MYGSSYVGATQWLAAVTAPPHLVTIVPANTASDYFDGWIYEDGEFRLAFVLPWAIGLLPLPRRPIADDHATAAALNNWRPRLGSHAMAGLPPLPWPSGAPTRQSGCGPLVLPTGSPIRHVTASGGNGSIRDRYSLGAGAGARRRGMVRRLPRRRDREFHRDGEFGRARPRPARTNG